MTADTDTRALLRRRAAELAQRPPGEDRTPSLDLLVVVVGGRRLGFESHRVQQILPNQGLCRLPAECDALLGLVPARGVAVPVADLGSLLTGSAPDRERPYLVLIDGAAPLGLLVDEVTTVLRLPTHEVRARPEASPGTSMERGMTPDDVVVLDVDLLLTDPRVQPRPDHERPPEPATPAPGTLQENHAHLDHR